MICIITMYIRDTNMAYIHTLKYFLNMLFLVAALTESLFKCIILDVSPQFSNFIFFIHSIFKKYVVFCKFSGTVKHSQISLRYGPACYGMDKTHFVGNNCSQS